MRQFVSTAVSATLAICAVLLTALVIRREFASPQSEAPRALKGWATLAWEGHVLGPDTAPVKIIEFADFQCPACRAASSTLAAIRQRYAGRVAVVFRHFPLESIHPQALAAANASECAADQSRFEEFHDALFRNQPAVTVSDWQEVAREARVPDLPRFEECVRQQRFVANVRRDQRQGQQLNLRGTPSIILNGEVYTGLPDPDELERQVVAGLSAAK